MQEKEQQLRAELQELDAKLQDPAIYSDKSYPKLAKRQNELMAIVDAFDEIDALTSDIDKLEEVYELNQPELTEFSESGKSR